MCISVDDAKTIALYINQVHETRMALAGCSLVDLVPQ